MQRRNLRCHFAIKVFFLGFLGLAVGCSDESNSTSDGGGTTGDGGVSTADSAPLPSGVTFKTAGESAPAEFTTGSEEFLIIPYSTSETEAEAIEFTVKITNPDGKTDLITSRTSQALKFQKPLPLRLRNPKLFAYWQRRLALERWLRTRAERVAKLKMDSLPQRFSGPQRSCKLSSECSGATEICNSAGACVSEVTIKVEDFASEKTIQTSVKRKGQVAAILVDKANTVADGDLDKLLDTFEKYIWARDVALFGNPPLKEGESQLSSDRNADGLVWLVLTDKTSQKDADGFFNYTDFANATDEPKSNEADILYIDASLKPEKIFPTLAHELQHLLNYGSKVYKPKVAGKEGALEALWLDEGQAHFAEDACGYGGENVVALDQELFPNFSDTSMFQQKKENDSMAMRIMAFTFVRYLFEQKGGVTYNTDGTITDKGGAGFLQKLHNSSKQGALAVSEAYGDYKKAFGNWIATIALDGRGAIEDKRFNYQDLVEDPVTKAKVGVAIRGERKDDKGNTVTLKGPIEIPITEDTTEAIPNATGKFFQIKEMKGNATVSVESQDTDFYFAVIKIK